MKFGNLTINNFLTITHASVNLKDRGLQLIQGANDDDSSATSNGAGKSSLVDAICWVLYGVTAREVKGDEVINRKAKKNCYVALTMSNGASTYYVTRHRKDATGKNSLVVLAGTTDLSKGTDAETQKVLEKILGCSYEVFVAAVYSGQEAMPDLPKMKDKELKMLIEESAGLSRIERAYEIARERMNAAKGAIISAQTALIGANSSLLAAESRSKEASVLYSGWAGDRDFRVKESEAAYAAAYAEEVAAGIVLAEEGIAMKNASATIKEIDAALADHKRLDDHARHVESDVRRMEMAIDAGMLKRLAADVSRLEAQIANAAEEIKKPCSECGTVLETMSIEDFVAHRTTHLNAAKERLEAAKVTARGQMVALQSMRETAKDARAAVPDVSELTAARVGHAATVTRWNALEADFKRRQANTTAAQAQVALRSSETNPHEPLMASSNKAVESAAEKRAAAATAETQAQKALDVANAVVKVFGPAGVRAEILDSVTPHLNARTADYLSVLSDGEITAVWTTLTRSASGDLKEKFSIDVSHAKGGESFRALSGGEKRKVRLACALALQDLVASRATQPIDLWCGDEIDDALDPAGLERLMTILERKARERGTVLIISHSDLRDWVDEVTIVRKGEQFQSTVEGALVVCS